MELFVTLTELERRTGIKANTIRNRVWRGESTPVPVYRVDGLGLAVKEDELRTFLDNLKPVSAPAA